MIFPHKNIDLDKLQDIIQNELGIEPISRRQLRLLVWHVLTSIPDMSGNTIHVHDDQTGEEARYIIAPKFQP